MEIKNTEKCLNCGCELPETNRNLGYCSSCAAELKTSEKKKVYVTFYKLKPEEIDSIVKKQKTEEKSASNFSPIEDFELDGGVLKKYVGKDSIVRIPDFVTKIAAFAFFNCTNLIKIHIPESVTEIGHSAFSGCINLVKVHIPASVTKIAKFTFSDCTSLKGVYIPDFVTEIGYKAFWNCTNLIGVYVPDYVNYVGMGAFFNCYQLTISIPNHIKEDLYESFSGCKKIIKR